MTEDARDRLQTPGYVELRQQLDGAPLWVLEERPFLLEPRQGWLCDHVEEGPNWSVTTGPRVTYAVRCELTVEENADPAFRVALCLVSNDCDLGALTRLIEDCRERVARYGQHPDPRVDSLALPWGEPSEDEFERTRFLTALEFDVPPGIIHPMKESETLPLATDATREWLSDGRMAFDGIQHVTEGPSYAIRVREVRAAGGEGVCTVEPDEIRIKPGRDPKIVRQELTENYPMVMLQGNPTL